MHTPKTKSTRENAKGWIEYLDGQLQELESEEQFF